MFSGKGKLIVDKDVLDKDGNVISEGNDAYRALTLSKKLTQNRIESTQSEINNLIEGARKISSESGTPTESLIKSLDEYLHAKYAKEF